MHYKTLPLSDVWRTCNKIRAAAFRSGLDLWQWFLPLDPNRDTLLPECKFAGVLAGPELRAVLALSEQEVTQLADYFRAQDGRVLYAQLCRLVHGEEWPRSQKPLADSARSASGAATAGDAGTTATLTGLNSRQVQRVRTLLAALAARNLPLQPYFQDYELVAQSDGGVTFPHFGRVVSSAGVPLAPDDLALLVRCFIRDSYTVDYVRFLRALEAHRQGVDVVGVASGVATGDARNDGGDVTAAVALEAIESDIAGVEGGASGRRENTRAAFVPVLELMHRIQKRVLQRRIRVAEWFRDFDPLNGGRVTSAQFARALDAVMGGDVAPSETLCLTAHYTDHNDANRVCWRTFEDDCERVFTVKELEKHPDLDAEATVASARASSVRRHDAAAGCVVHRAARHNAPALASDTAETDILLILARIKEKMVREGF